MTNRQAEKKIEIAIDKLIDLKDDGRGCDDIARCLEILNHILIKIPQKK